MIDLKKTTNGKTKTGKTENNIKDEKEKTLKNRKVNLRDLKVAPHKLEARNNLRTRSPSKSSSLNSLSANKSRLMTMKSIKIKNIRRNKESTKSLIARIIKEREGDMMPDEKGQRRPLKKNESYILSIKTSPSKEVKSVITKTVHDGWVYHWEEVTIPQYEYTYEYHWVDEKDVGKYDPKDVIIVEDYEGKTIEDVVNALPKDELPHVGEYLVENKTKPDRRLEWALDENIPEKSVAEMWNESLNASKDEEELPVEKSKAEDAKSIHTKLVDKKEDITVYKIADAIKSSRVKFDLMTVAESLEAKMMGKNTAIIPHKKLKSKIPKDEKLSTKSQDQYEYEDMCSRKHNSTKDLEDSKNNESGLPSKEITADKKKTRGKENRRGKRGNHDSRHKHVKSGGRKRRHDKNKVTPVRSSVKKKASRNNKHKSPKKKTPKSSVPKVPSKSSSQNKTQKT